MIAMCGKTNAELERPILKLPKPTLPEEGE